MHFGQYLIDKKVISKDQLIKALTFQLDNMPSLLSTLYEEKIFETDMLLKAVHYQVSESVDLYSVLKNHHFLDESGLKKVMDLHSKKRIPLGQILVKKNILTITETQKLLNDYLVGINQAKTTVETGTTKETEKESTDKNGAEIETREKVEAAFPDSKFEDFKENLIEKNVIGEYLEIFDENKKSLLETAVSSWEKLSADGKTEEIHDSIRRFYRELHILKGAVRFLKAEVSEFLVSRMEELLVEAQQTVDRLSGDDFKLAEAYFLDGIGMLWTLRNEIGEKHSELTLLDRNGWKSDCSGFLNKMQEFTNKYALSD